MARVVILQDWFVRFDRNDPYAAPEALSICLAGTAIGHPRRAALSHVVTSPVVAARGRVVQTRSGTRYRLGRVDPGYRKWLRQQGIAYDPRQPVTVRS